MATDTFSTGFNRSLSTMLGFARLGDNLIEKELAEEKLAAQTTPFVDLGAKVEAGEATVLETDAFSTAKTNLINSQIEELTNTDALRTSQLQNLQLDNALLANTFEYMYDVSKELESGELVRGSTSHDMAIQIGASYMDQISDKGLDIYEVISPKYVKALKDSRQALDLLQNGDPAGLEALANNSDSLSEIFKPKTINYFGKRFVSSDGKFEGKIIDVNPDLAKTELTENAEAAIILGNFTVRNDDIYKAAIEKGASKEAAEAQATKIFSSYMPDITSDVIKQSDKNLGDAVQVSVKDMVDFAGSSTQLVSTILRTGDSEIFKFVAEAKDNSQRRANVLDPEDIAEINIKVLETYNEQFDKIRTAFVEQGGDKLLNRYKKGTERKNTAQELNKVIEILGPKKTEFTKFIQPHSDESYREQGLFEWNGSLADSSIQQAFINTYPSKAEIRADLMMGQETEPKGFPAVPSTDELKFIKGNESFNVSTANYNQAISQLENNYGKDFLENEIQTIKNVAAARKINLSEKEILFLLQKSLR